MHQISRVRHELRRRKLEVLRVEQVTPAMLRIWLGGQELDGFTSLGADDHIKIFVPGVSGMEMRDFTPRHYDDATNELVIDFALHDAGPATAWARGANVGDTVEIGGPRGSVLVPADFDWWLLIGDETALPAMGRRLEELPQGTVVFTIAAVAQAAEEQAFATRASLQARWVHRPLAEAGDVAPLLDALKSIVLPAGDGFIWIAAEASVARALRAHVLCEMRHTPQWLKASGYWVQGRADAHEKFEN